MRPYSFAHDTLCRCRSLAAEIPVAALEDKAHRPDLVDYLRALGACAYHPADALVDEALVRRLRAEGVPVNVFTVNDPGRQRELFAWGVRGVFTDWIDPV